MREFAEAWSETDTEHTTAPTADGLEGMTTEEKARAFRRMVRHPRPVDATDSGAAPLEGMTEAEKREAFEKLVGRADG